LKNFPRRHQEISVATTEILDAQELFFKPTNPLCTSFNIIQQHYCTTQTHENIMTERQASDIFLSIRRSGISCDGHHLYEPNWTLNSSVTCISKKIYETRSDERHTAWIKPRVPSVRVDTEREFHPWFPHSIKHTKSTK
jgi:hypothetical protein